MVETTETGQNRFLAVAMATDIFGQNKMYI